MYKIAFNRLPDYLRKPNNESLYDVAYGGINELRDTLYDIEDSRDIDKAFGQTLDYIGSNVGQLRPPEATDEEFRELIRIRIMANRSAGDIPTINNIMSSIFKNYKGISEGWNNFSDEPAALMMYVDETTRVIPLNIANAIRAAGVRLSIMVESSPDILEFILTSYEFPNQLKITDMFTTEDEVPGIFFNKHGSIEHKMYAFKVHYGITDIMRTETIIDTDTNIKIEMQNYNPHNKVEFIRPGIYQAGEGEI